MGFFKKLGESIKFGTEKELNNLSDNIGRLFEKETPTKKMIWK